MIPDQKTLISVMRPTIRLASDTLALTKQSSDAHENIALANAITTFSEWLGALQHIQADEVQKVATNVLMIARRRVYWGATGSNEEGNYRMAVLNLEGTIMGVFGEG